MYVLKVSGYFWKFTRLERSSLRLKLGVWEIFEIKVSNNLMLRKFILFYENNTYFLSQLFVLISYADSESVLKIFKSNRTIRVRQQRLQKGIIGGEGGVV